MVCDNDSAASCRLLGINTVLDTETSLLDCIVENGSIFVVANTAKEDNAVGWEKVLSTTGGVLRSTSCDELGRIVV